MFFGFVNSTIPFNSFILTLTIHPELDCEFFFNILVVVSMCGMFLSLCFPYVHNIILINLNRNEISWNSIKKSIMLDGFGLFCCVFLCFLHFIPRKSSKNVALMFNLFPESNIFCVFYFRKSATRELHKKWICYNINLCGIDFDLFQLY